MLRKKIEVAKTMKEEIKTNSKHI